MNSKMKITGAAPLIAILTFLYLILAVIISNLTSPRFAITHDRYSILVVLGILLMAAGIPMVVHCGRKLLAANKKESLMTDGLYSIFRDPMYAAYLLFIIPGICLLFNSWLVLTTVVVNYILYSIFIKREHKYLEEKFGDEYEEYLKNVFIKFL